MRRLAIALVPLVILALVISGIGCRGDGGSKPGPFRRTAAEAYDTDEEIMQLATATFYSDLHAGYNDDAGTWCDSAMAASPGHFYPTKLGHVAEHTLVVNTSALDLQVNPRIDSPLGTAATDAEISDHAIWMGLLVNAAGECIPVSGGSSDRGAVSPLQNDIGLYLQDIPESAMAGNAYNGGSEPGGSYCWVVGENGKVHGAYAAADGNWYSGFSGVYP